ncbi:MAG: class I SAM-dependent methyltransferase [Planctomycetota bacterium]|nr:class I SAM-dependent methyltransferase [Planctomycetota bacterium]
MRQKLVDSLDEYYRAQAEWTYQTRNYIYRRTGILVSKEPLLEIGCATGTITAELARRSDSFVIGIDKNKLLFNKKAKENSPSPVFVCADACYTPFKPSSFSAVIFHFSLMWLDKPLVVLKECLRILKPGGYALALSEPDYSGAIEVPSFPSLKEAMIHLILESGGDPFIAQKMSQLFSSVGFEVIETGPLSRPLSSDIVCKKMAPLLKLLSDISPNEGERLADFRPSYAFYPVFYLIARKR